ncbi:MAG: hypothetical protein ACI9M6_001049, partial [Hydrogenophaga sp.]
WRSALNRPTRDTTCSCGPACAMPMARARLSGWPHLAGLGVRALWAVAIREDQGQPVMGWYVLLQGAETQATDA